MYDVVIIGGGVSGCAIARELSRYELKICVVEREEDVCCGTSKANSAIVHGGFDAPHGSLMARLNVLGSGMMPGLSQELEFDYHQNGSLVLCFDENDRPDLERLLQNGRQNGVEGLRIIEREELLELEPNINDDVVAALYAPTSGIVCPFGLTVALAENAAQNGVEFCFDTRVIGFTKLTDSWIVRTQSGDISCRAVVNAAGVYAGELHNMVATDRLKITPRRGQYLLFDKSAGGHVRHTVFRLPGKMGKGVLVTPTVHGNLLVGPTAEDIEDPEGTNTTAQGMQSLLEKAEQSVKNLPKGEVITSFAGLRAHESGHEFVIEAVKGIPLFMDCAGIESPGLSAAPAIGVYVAQKLCEIMALRAKPDWQAGRKCITNSAKLPKDERAKLIASDPTYGNIICRCEQISEGEILEAIRRTPGARSLDGIKRRVRAGMGRCQGGFCSPRVMEILARELGLDDIELTKSGGESALLCPTAEGRSPDGEV